MKVRKFLAATSHEVLRKVKDELGPDAVILSNKQVPGGIEIMALAGKDISSLTSDTPPEATSPAVKTAAAPRKSLLPKKSRHRLFRSNPQWQIFRARISSRKSMPCGSCWKNN